MEKQINEKIIEMDRNIPFIFALNQIFGWNSR